MGVPNDNIRYVVNYGMGLFNTLFVVLLTLKLCGVIQCSWFVVFLPLVLPFFISLLFMLLFWGIIYFIDYVQRKKYKF